MTSLRNILFLIYVTRVRIEKMYFLLKKTSFNKIIKEIFYTMIIIYYIELVFTLCNSYYSF